GTEPYWRTDSVLKRCSKLASRPRSPSPDTTSTRRAPPREIVIMNEPSSRLSFLIRSAALAASSPTRRLARPTVAAAAFAIALLGVVRGASAQAPEEADTIAKATQLNKDAIAAYQAHKNDDAKRLLKQALDLCDASGLDQHPVKARTLIHFGIVLIGGSKQRDL